MFYYGKKIVSFFSHQKYKKNRNGGRINITICGNLKWRKGKYYNMCKFKIAEG